MGPVESGFGDALKVCSWVGPEHGAEVALARALAKELDDGLGDGRALGSIANSYSKVLSQLRMTPDTSPPVVGGGSRLEELVRKHDDES